MAVRLIFVPATPAVPQIKEEPAKKMMGKDVILKNYKRAADYKNAVKVAGYRNPPPPLAQVSMDAEDARPGAPLRKIAQLLRTQEDARAVHLFEKSATALKAIRGLTLLRERVTR